MNKDIYRPSQMIELKPVQESHPLSSFELVCEMTELWLVSVVLR